VALLDAADQAQWQAWTKDLGWRVIVPVFPAGATASPPIDVRVQALAAGVAAAVQAGGVDPARIYLAGRGEAAAAVFYCISRMPDLWAAGLALGGSAQAAIDTGRIFTANFTIAPVLWASSGPDDQALAAALKAAGLNLEWRPANGIGNAAIFEWLAKHRREPFPLEIDCETNSPTFARCYWVEMSKFDVGERNDVLPFSFVRPGAAATLDLGGFSYSREDPGPGLLVSLPEKYSGPLKKGDRLVALEGKEIRNAPDFAAQLARITEERPVAVLVQRGKDRVRVETRVIVPKREIPVTARVEAKYLPAENEIQIVSRTVKEMRVTIPPAWASGARLYWNGLSLENIQTPGCLLLTVDKELLHAAKCP